MPTPRPNEDRWGQLNFVHKIKRTLEFENLIIHFHISLSCKRISLKEMTLKNHEVNDPGFSHSKPHSSLISLK